MAMNQLSQEQYPSSAWPWGVAMYTNLHYQQQYHYEKEHLFEKVLTPSDVGKLNRLVIPKQHAEKCFPLGGVGDSGEKGLLLSFEDEAGKPWRFRYSYWTSSQSYVLTKGWSRYIKEKHLDAGDVVHFERVRGFGTGDRLFIGCRRRSDGAPTAVAPPPAVRLVPASGLDAREQQPWSPMCYSTSGSYPASPANSHVYRRSIDHDHSDMHHAGESAQWDTDTRSCSTASAPTTRRLRLFGVNVDCGPEPEADATTPTSMYGYIHHHQSPYTTMSPVPSNWGSS